MAEVSPHGAAAPAVPAHAIAIIGMAGRFPGAEDLESFWRQVAAGVEQLEELSAADLEAAGVPPTERSHPAYVPRGTFLQGSEDFDAGFFGYAPRDAQVLDPQQRIFLECAWEALEHAGYGAAAGRPESVGVFAGASMNTYLTAQVARNPALARTVGGYQLMLANDKDFLCTRVSYKLGLRGPSMTVQTACSTSLVAVQVACRAVQRGECDMALAGGVSVIFPQRTGYMHQEGMIFSPDGHCRPFDEQAQGTRAGAGAGLVVLKRLDRALADGDTVHAVIRGIAVNNDGAQKAGYTAPSVEGQVEAIVTALALADVPARSVSYVEAHGTATPLGDPIEIAALTQAYRGDTEDRGFCRLGSLKANLGHLDAAAGVAGLIKTVLALQHRELPPLVNFRKAHPALRLEESPFYASASGASWTPSAASPRRAGVSSFGIGGTNAHAVVEEAPEPLPRHEAAGRPQLLVWSARSEVALDHATQRLAHHLDARPEQPLADVAYTLQVGREEFTHRRALVVTSREQAVAALKRRAGLLGGRHGSGARPVALLFSGQGSQHAGMGRGLYESEAVYRDAVDRCAALLEAHVDADIRVLMFDTDSATGRLDHTRYTQPALFVAEYALAMLWQARGVAPAAMIGHSIGEYVAAHLAGVFSLADALAVVAARGRLMQQQPAGAMAAVPLAPAALASWLEGTRVEIAAVNGSEFCTVAGPTEAVETLVAGLAGRGVEARLLRTSHAFHSSMMESALAPFQALMRSVRLSPPRLRYVSNVTGTWITSAQATSPAYWAEHLRRPVQFDAGLRTLVGDRDTAGALLLEVGPGQSLCALARRVLGAEAPTRVIASMRRANEQRADGEALLDATARLWLAGCAIEWAGAHDGARRRRVPLPTYPFERQRHGVLPTASSANDAPNFGSREPQAIAATNHARRSVRVDDWFYAPTWCRDDAEPRRAEGDVGARWLVLGDDGPLTEALLAELAQRGLRTALAQPGSAFQRIGPDTWRVDPRSTDALGHLVEEATVAQPLAGVVHVWGLPGAAAKATLDGAATYDALVALGTALPAAAPGRPALLLHASAGAESVLGEPVLDARLALAAGPALVLPLERPAVLVRTVDLDAAHLSDSPLSVQNSARALADEMWHAAGDVQVARRAGQRWVRRYERLSLPLRANDSLPLRRRGCYLITGGVGGMGLTLARWLGIGLQARLVLTSRRALPHRDTWQAWLAEQPEHDPKSEAMRAIQEIEAAGGEVLLAAADAADRSAMAAALAAAQERFGDGLHGVFHAAGNAGQGNLAELSDPSAARATFAPKVEGLSVLGQLLGAHALDIVVLASSISAAIGSPGTCDYAAANAALDAFVDSAERPPSWRRVVSINWGAWRDLGMAARLDVPEAMRARWAEHLAGAIAPAAAIEALERVLATGRRRVVVETYDVVQQHEEMRLAFATAAGGPEGRADASAAPPPAEEPAAPAAMNSRPPLSTPFVAPDTAVERRLATIWEDLLGVRGIGVQDDFFELGGHSLMFTRLLARIDEDFGAKLPLRDVFDVATIQRLAELLSSRAHTPPTGATPPATAREVLEI